MTIEIGTMAFTAIMVMTVTWLIGRYMSHVVTKDSQIQDKIYGYPYTV